MLVGHTYNATCLLPQGKKGGKPDPKAKGKGAPEPPPEPVALDAPGWEAVAACMQHLAADVRAYEEWRDKVVVSGG